jgi:hypothetical protein
MVVTYEEGSEGKNPCTIFIYVISPNREHELEESLDKLNGFSLNFLRACC